MAGTATLDADPPGVAPFEYCFHVPHDPRAVGVTRASLRAALTAHGIPELIDKAELLACELLTNAFRHTRGEAELRLTWARGTLRVAVWDTSPVFPALVAADDDSEHGRGLHLLAALADRWDHFPVRADMHSAPTKVVWCEISCSSPTTVW